MQYDRAAVARDDEIDLIELVQGVWQHKWLMLATAFIITLVAVAYALLVKPVYEAKVYVLPPTQSGMAGFNFGRSKDTNLEPFAVKDVYDVFLRNLYSEDLRRKFFHDYFLASLTEEERSGSQDRLYARFNEEVRLSSPAKDSPDRYGLTVYGENPARAAEWATTYLTWAGTNAKTEMIKNVEREAEVQAGNLLARINLMRESARQAREDEEVRLREALNVADAINLQNPPVISGTLSAQSQVSASMDGPLTYMQGSKALRAQIGNLDARASDDAFIQGLRDLQSQQAFFKNLRIDQKTVQVFRQDGPIEVPDSPVKPRKALIVALGLVLGLMLGLTVALARYLYVKATLSTVR